MCVTCGCGRGGRPHGPLDEPGFETGLRPSSTSDTTELLHVEQRLLAKNDALADHVRESLAVRRVAAVNLMSSPGAGKTSLAGAHHCCVPTPPRGVRDRR